MMRLPHWLKKRRRFTIPIGCPTAGMRRVDFVVVITDNQGRIRREAHGVGHRLPCARVISQRAMLDLAATRVPIIIRQARRSPSGPGA
jgi:hypothetical protein